MHPKEQKKKEGKNFLDTRNFFVRDYHRNNAREELLNKEQQLSSGAVRIKRTAPAWPYTLSSSPLRPHGNP